MANDSIALDTVDNVDEYCARKANEIEDEIEHLGVALEIDWANESQVRELAKEALHHAQREIEEYEHEQDNYHQRAKITLFGLAALMMDIMAKSASKGIHTHGGMAWKSFSKALMIENEMSVPAQEGSEKSKKILKE
jgi:hypothetical protein